MRLLLYVVTLLALPLNIASAQPLAGYDDGARKCELAPEETRDKLLLRKELLDRDLAQALRATKKQVKRATHDESPDLRKIQEEILETVAKIECAENLIRIQTRTPSETMDGGIIEAAVFYATDRRQSEGQRSPTELFTAQYGGVLKYGRATVTIPRSHRRGNLELPSIFKLEREADPTKHFTLRSVVQLASDAAFKDIAEQLAAAPAKSLLLFVHGFNTSFADAALRTAQLSYDLEFKGVPFFYSWPSSGTYRGYWQDEETARLSERSFEQLLDDLSKLPVAEVYIVAHSMGCRIVGHALQHRAEKRKDMRQLRQLLFAAPDINADIFRSVIAPGLAALKGMRTTIYAASTDFALVASRVVHGFPRVGETNGRGKIFTYPGFETVDASLAVRSTLGVGHAYVVDSPSVLSDIASNIAIGASAKQRGLVEVRSSPNSYWLLR